MDFLWVSYSKHVSLFQTLYHEINNELVDSLETLHTIMVLKARAVTLNSPGAIYFSENSNTRAVLTEHPYVMISYPQQSICF